MYRNCYDTLFYTKLIFLDKFFSSRNLTSILGINIWQDWPPKVLIKHVAHCFATAFCIGIPLSVAPFVEHFVYAFLGTCQYIGCMMACGWREQNRRLR